MADMAREDLVKVLHEEFGLPYIMSGRQATDTARKFGVVLNYNKSPVKIHTLAEYLIPRLPKVESDESSTAAR